MGRGNAPNSRMYQGILQVGLAFLQIERDNWHGALKMFRRGLPKLRTLPDSCQGVDMLRFERKQKRFTGT